MNSERRGINSKCASGGFQPQLPATTGGWSRFVLGFWYEFRSPEGGRLLSRFYAQRRSVFWLEEIANLGS